jgi:hypothetical protein
MSERSGAVRRYLTRKAARKVVAKVGAVKLAAIGAAVLGAFLVFLIVLAALAGASSAGEGKGGMVCTTSGGSESPPAKLVPIYAAAAAKYHLGARGPGILAAINYVESDFGRSQLPGVAPGTQNYAGAEGPMQFLQSSWEAYGVDGNGDGTKDAYDATDAIFGAAHLLHVDGAPGDWYGAIFDYNHADWYVREVEADARKFGGSIVCRPTEGVAVGGNADLQRVETLYEPRAFKAIPQSLWVGGGAPEVVDSRLWPDAIWLLETFHLRVSAAREIGHNTHGDGTAMDMVPEAGKGWDETARAAAETLGWRESCGASGTAPVCPLVPAIQFIGYNGYPGHGDPAHAGENAHLHVSWQSSSFGSASLSPPPAWARIFPLGG